MTAIPVSAHRARSTVSAGVDLRADIERAKRIARLLDSEFSIAGVRFGLDAIVGLVPAVGDAIGFLAGLYPIHIVRKHRLGRDVEVKMIVNLLIDALAGAVPIVGDFIDVAFKANLKNVALLESAAASVIENRAQ
jgi:hypothetical protein